MKSLSSLLLGVALVSVTVCSVAFGADDSARDQAAIRDLEKRFEAAFKAKDVNTIMTTIYWPDERLHAFDAAPLLDTFGARALTDNWAKFFGSLPGTVDTFEVQDLTIMNEGNLAVAHMLHHIVFREKDGKKMEMTMRVTDAYRKINGKWFIVHEHLSLPFDPATGKCVYLSKP